jgi:acyl-CoA synthetase (AMP-forming)/AMP-acid ligase II
MSFGTTETMTICTSRSEEAPEQRKDVNVAICGRPLPGNVLKIVDPLTGVVLPRGQIGEMCIKGPTLMTGYLGKGPELCFDAEGFYRTGDGGHLDQWGRFIWDGRLTDMIKTGGANVAPMEVDEVIVRFPGVKRTQTIGIPDDLLGEMVVTCIVPVEGQTLDPEAIAAFVKKDVASFKVPKQILFFTDDEYAITGNEKIKASTVRELAMKRLGIEKPAEA